jgi:hypothetical protein
MEYKKQFQDQKKKKLLAKQEAEEKKKLKGLQLGDDVTAQPSPGKKKKIKKRAICAKRVKIPKTIVHTEP